MKSPTELRERARLLRPLPCNPLNTYEDTRDRDLADLMETVADIVEPPPEDERLSLQVKRYALFGGECYYPSGGWDDFLSWHETVEKAHAGGKRFLRRGDRTDRWCEIVDMRVGKIIHFANTPEAWKSAIKENLNASQSEPTDPHQV